MFRPYSTPLASFSNRPHTRLSSRQVPRSLVLPRPRISGRRRRMALLRLCLLFSHPICSRRYLFCLVRLLLLEVDLSNLVLLLWINRFCLCRLRLILLWWSQNLENAGSALLILMLQKIARLNIIV
jgi:hypothetical protein